MVEHALGARRTTIHERSDFRRIWSALTIALFGTQITTLALPLAAAMALGASPLQMGLLAAAGQAPFLVCSLPLGVWVDRAARLRPLLVGADLGRAALLAVIPLAAAFGRLQIELLYAVAIAAGILSVLFDVAHMAYVPSLVGRARIAEANGKIQVSYSSAESLGPGLSGILVRLVTAPFAIAATAGSFLMSALLLSSIGRKEAPRTAPAEFAGLRSEMVDGLRALLGHPLLRPIVVTSAALGLFVEAIRAMYVLFAVREIHLGPAQIGVILAFGGAAAVPGGLLAGRIAERIGFGTAVVGGCLVSGASFLLVPLAGGRFPIAILAGAAMIGGFGEAVANVNQWSLRQIVTPDHLQGRVTASHRCLVYGAFPLGSLMGGALATTMGLRPAIAVCAIGASLAPLLLLRSPIRGLHRSPTAAGT